MASFTVTFDDGTTYTVDEANLLGSDSFGYADPTTVDGTAFDYTFTGLIWAMVRSAASAYVGFSTTSVAIGTGSKAFTATAQRPWFVGSYVRIEEDGTPANYMAGDVTAYNATTGALTVNVTDTGGSGTIADWKILSLGAKGDTGATGGISGGTLTGNLDFGGYDALNMGAKTNNTTDKGSVGSGTVTFDVSENACQKLTVTGALTVAFSGWPATGKKASIEIEAVNWGSATVTLPTINWALGDGTYSTTFADMGVTLNASGTNTIIVWSSDGTTLYGVAA